MTYIIDAHTVHKMLIEEPENLILIDVRFNLSNSDSGQEAYEGSHLPNAHYLHMEKDLSGEVKKHGGNHPLPELDVIVDKLSDIGVSHDKTVVIYDEKSDMFAPRAWWILHYLGHESSYVLNGGYSKWVEEGYKVTSDIPNKNQATFTPKIKDNLIAHIDEVKDHLAKEDVLIDSRARERYLGKVEPLYAKKGHIPGAVNFFWGDLINEEGLWKSKEALKTHFNRLNKDDDIIVSCGSGVSACPNVLALKMLGYDNVKLYPGSFSDWISYEENEVETTER